MLFSDSLKRIITFIIFSDDRRWEVSDKAYIHKKKNIDGNKA